MAISIPVSWGELFDKVTILQIKEKRISDPAKNANVRRELAELQKTLKKIEPLSSELQDLMHELRAINNELWEIEDTIRGCERNKSFDDVFISLARAVYHSNDKRAALKKKINVLLGSEIVEEKSYESYT